MVEVHFDCAGSQNLVGWRGTALSLWCRADFSTWSSRFVAGARETSWFGGPKLTFRDRRSEWPDVDVQALLQAQYFGHGGGLWGALFS